MFYLITKVTQTLPVGAPSRWPLFACWCVPISLCELPCFLVPQDAPGSSSIIPVQPLNKPSLQQRALALANRTVILWDHQRPKLLISIGVSCSKAISVDRARKGRYIYMEMSSSRCKALPPQEDLHTPLGPRLPMPGQTCGCLTSLG